MNDQGCGVPEERWADWHLRRLPEDTAAALARHLEGCPACRRVCREWGEWLAADGCGESRAGALMPAKRVWRSLRRRMWRRALRKRLGTRPAWHLAAAAMVFLLVLAGVRWQHIISHAGGQPAAVAMQPKAYAEMHEPEGALLMERPDTVVYTAGLAPAGSPSAAGKPNLTVWVNGETEEVFVFMEGLLPEGNREVQAWSAARQGLTSLGLLKFHYAQGHLYSRLMHLPEVERLSFTIEPKGGSRLPTSPQSAEVVLAAGK